MRGPQRRQRALSVGLLEADRIALCSSRSQPQGHVGAAEMISFGTGKPFWYLWLCDSHAGSGIPHSSVFREAWTVSSFHFTLLRLVCDRLLLGAKLFF